MSDTITTPITRAVDRALRLLQLTYRMMAPHRGASAVDVLHQVGGYAGDGDAVGSAARKFEHDKRALRSYGIPIHVHRDEERRLALYKVQPRDLFLPMPSADPAGWDMLRQSTVALQWIADRVNQLRPGDAAASTTVLLAYSQQLGLQLAPWNIPRVMLTNGPLLLDWVHSVLFIAAANGRRHRQWGGTPVRLAKLSTTSGLSKQLLWHVVERADRHYASQALVNHLVSVAPFSRNQGVSVVAPEMRSSWRPPLKCAEKVVEVARGLGVPLPSRVQSTLLSHAR